MMPTRVLAILATGAILATSCSGSESSDPTTPSSTDAIETEPTSAATTALEESGDAAAASDSSDESDGTDTSDEAVDATTPAAPVDTTPATTAPPLPPEPLFGEWEANIAIEAAPGEFEGRPMLSWTAVDGADHYGVYIYDADGQIYWAWRGTATSTPFGGDIGNGAGPTASRDMKWAVIAWDAELRPVVASLVEPLTF